MATVQSLAGHPEAGQRTRSGRARPFGLVEFQTSGKQPRRRPAKAPPISRWGAFTNHGRKAPPGDGRRWLTISRELARVRRCKHAILARARCIDAQVQRGGALVYAAMLTLTYAKVDAWAPRHVSDALENIRKWMQARGQVLRYVWVAELQERGAVHYHVVLWLPRGVRIPKPDRRGWWPHGSSRIEGARKPIGYLVKYASKLETVEKFPRGIRLAGAGGLDEQARQEASWMMLPQYVRDAFAPSDRVRRAPGGGFLAALTGEWIGSAWCLWDRAADWSWVTFAERLPGGDRDRLHASSEACGDVNSGGLGAERPRASHTDSSPREPACRVELRTTPRIVP